MPRIKLRWRRDKAIQALGSTSVSATWDRLNRQQGDLPFLASTAIRHALEVFGSGDEVLFTGLVDGEPMAMFVLAPVGLLRWTTFQPSQLPLGSWVASPSIALSELVRGLFDGPLGMCLVLSITQVDPRHASRGLDDARQTFSDYIETGWLEIAGKFEDYWASRGKNLRQNMRKQRNKLASEGTTTLMRVLRAEREMGPALSRYGQLESAGWKADQGTAIHPDNDQGRFYLRLLEDAASDQEAVIYEYLFGDRTVAMNLCLIRNGQLVVLKTAYDETIKSLSPAFMLREEELQSMFAGEEVRRVEYYGRVMDWHTKLTDKKRTLFHLTAYRWAWVKQLAGWRRSNPLPALAQSEDREGTPA